MSKNRGPACITGLAQEGATLLTQEKQEFEDIGGGFPPSRDCCRGPACPQKA